MQTVRRPIAVPAVFFYAIGKSPSGKKQERLSNLREGCTIKLMKKKRKIKKSYGILLLSLLFLAPLCRQVGAEKNSGESFTASEAQTDIAPFSGEISVVLNNNVPDFTPEEKENTAAFEYYSELDDLGRCGAAFANICPELMPVKERGEIGQIRPSGWQLVKYDIVEGKYLYNRCHLIGYQLAGENANEKNLITGTRYFNVSGMLPFENQVADYVRSTGNHVLYRVTPVYRGDDLVAEGVRMEAYSVEDRGEGICFHVFVYNIQPGIRIDYATGESCLEEGNGETDPESGRAEAKETETETTYILNTNTKKFHLPSCESVGDIKEKNRREVTADREELILEGYTPCQRCDP